MLMRPCLLAAIAIGLCSGAESDCKPYAPCYSAESVVNIASGEAGALAPNTLASIRGTGLWYWEQGLTSADAAGGRLPPQLPGTGVTILVGGIVAHPFYVSPAQINFLVPSSLRATQVELRVVRDAQAGPPVTIRLREEAPALFLKDSQYVIASHLDFSLVTEEAPARRGQWLVLWATGLGATDPPAEYGGIPMEAARLMRGAEFQVLLDGVPVPAGRINYAGLAPQCAGLYQINVLVPEDAPANPEVRIGVGQNLSPAGPRVHLRP